MTCLLKNMSIFDAGFLCLIGSHFSHVLPFRSPSLTDLMNWSLRAFVHLFSGFQKKCITIQLANLLFQVFFYAWRFFPVRFKTLSQGYEQIIKQYSETCLNRTLNKHGIMYKMYVNRNLNKDHMYNAGNLCYHVRNW